MVSFSPIHPLIPRCLGSPLRTATRTYSTPSTIYSVTSSLVSAGGLWTVQEYQVVTVGMTIETRPFRTFASVNRREPVRIWCEYANTRRLRPLRQSHTTSDEISACEYGANVVRMCENLGEHVRPGPEYACGATSR